MTTTTYYNLNIVEGTDVVNPLTVDNPNYEKIDETMHDNAVAGVTLATEITNATVHAITRENSDCAVIRFIATSQWKAGDTATVDGVPVTALLPSGETLPDGAYVINANVLCILTGTNLTIYAERKKAENANEIAYNNTTVGAELVRLDGENVRQDEEILRLDGKIDNVNGNFKLNKSVIANKVNIYRAGNTVCITVDGVKPATAGAWITIGTIATESWRPPQEIYTSAYVTNALTNYGAIAITAAGAVQIISSGAEVFGSVTYLVDNQVS